MVVNTLHGFVVTDVIFGVVCIVALGLCDITTAIYSAVWSEISSPLRRSSIATKASARDKGSRKRNAVSSALSNCREIGIFATLALDRLC
jgi:hypothetical protein